MFEIISNPKRVNARKNHKCNFCDCIINSGELYSRAVYKYEDSVYSWKSHIKCIELLDILDMEGDEGVSSDDFKEYVSNAFNSIWIDIDEDFFDSDDFIIPDLSKQIEFVYNHKTRTDA